MLGVLIGLILGAAAGFVSGIIIIIKRKTMAYEVWIPLLVLCVLATIVCRVEQPIRTRFTKEGLLLYLR